jgi:hypothetical protein
MSARRTNGPTNWQQSCRNFSNPANAKSTPYALNRHFERDFFSLLELQCLSKEFHTTSASQEEGSGKLSRSSGSSCSFDLPSFSKGDNHANVKELKHNDEYHF